MTKKIKLPEYIELDNVVDPDVSDLSYNQSLPKVIKEEPVKQNKEGQILTEEDFENDLILARNALRDNIKKGQEALDTAVEYSKLSDHPRWLETSSQIITSIGTSANSLIALHQRKKIIEKKDGQEEQKTVIENQNNLYITTEDLIKMIGKKKEE